MAHHHHGDARSSQRSKIEKIVGHADNHQYPADKAADMAYYENEKLDPLTMPATESIGPTAAGDPPGSAVKRK